MKKNYALLVNPDTDIGEAAKWTERYNVVILPDQDLQKSTLVLVLDYKTKEAMLDQKRPIPSGHFNLPNYDITPFLFGNHYAAITFLTEYNIVIGYDHIDNISE